MIIEYLFFLIIVVLTVVGSIVLRKLTLLGGITGGLLAILIYLGVGVTGIYMLGLFFLLGTIATSWKAENKKQLKSEEKNSRKRTMGQVLANGGVAGLAGILAIRFPLYESLWLILIAGSFSSAIADTLSSELGSVYGSRFFNILSFKKDKRGLDGVVSIEGFLIGIIGSFLIAVIYSSEAGWGRELWIIILAGIAGNLTDSIVGAAFERKGLIGNDMVNFLNTLLGALVAGALYRVYV